MSEEESVVEKKEFNLKLFLLKYLRYGYLFVISLALALGGAWLYNWYAPPVYRVASKLLIKDEASASARTLLKELEMPSQNKNLENEIEILRSHQLVGKALENLSFDVSYFLVGNIKTSEVYSDCPFKVEIDSLHHFAYFVPFSVEIIDHEKFRWSYSIEGEGEYSLTGQFGQSFQFEHGDVFVDWRDHAEPGRFADPGADKRKYQLKFHGEARQCNFYANRLNITPISGQSTIVEISLLDQVPQKGIDFLNALVMEYLQNDVNQKNRTADNTSIFIEEQLDKISADLREIESAREMYKTEKGIVDLSAESQAVLNKAQKIDERLANNQAKKTVISYLKEYVAGETKPSDMAPSTIDISDPLLNNLVETLHRMELERERLAVSNTENHPQFVPLDAEIKRTREMLKENIDNIENTIDRANAELERELQRVRGRIQGIPKTERELIGIERQYRIQESLYLYLLEKQAEVSISLASSVSDNRVVDKARASLGPVKPVKSKAYAIALIIGFIIPVLIIYFIEQMDDTVRDVGTIERMTNMPIIGIVGLNRAESNLIFSDHAGSSIAEAYRSVRTNLKFFGFNDQNNVLLITSSIGTEGKTFSAMNISSVLALGGKRTVLLGLDLRKPKIIEDFNLSNEKGMSTVLGGEHKLADVVQPSYVIKNLDVITSGPVPPNPSELIMSPQMDQLMKELKSEYDYIVIDSPPIGLVTDALILIKYATLSLFVVRQGVTRKQHLSHISQMHAQQKLGKIAVLFNAVKANRAMDGYSYGYHYGYGGGDGYYRDEKRDTSLLGKLKGLFSKT